MRARATSAAATGLEIITGTPVENRTPSDGVSEYAVERSLIPSKTQERPTGSGRVTSSTGSAKLLRPSMRGLATAILMGAPVSEPFDFADMDVPFLLRYRHAGPSPVELRLL